MEGWGGVSFDSLPFAFRFLFSCLHPLFGDVSQNGRMGDEGGGGGIRKPSCGQVSEDRGRPRSFPYRLTKQNLPSIK